MSSTMTAAELQAYWKQQRTDSPEAKPKPAYKQPTEMTADKFRLDHVDTEEHGLQRRGVKWFRAVYRMYLIASVPNAAKRSPTQIQTMLDEGLTRGFPDLIVPIPAGEFHGLYIETKVRKKGRVSDDQAKIHAFLRSMGYEVLIPYTFEEFQSGVDDYLSKRI